MEILVILHTSNGDVTTAYKLSQVASAMAHFQAYLNEGNQVTMTNVHN